MPLTEILLGPILSLEGSNVPFPGIPHWNTEPVGHGLELASTNSLDQGVQGDQQVERAKVHCCSQNWPRWKAFQPTGMKPKPPLRPQKGLPLLLPHASFSIYCLSLPFAAQALLLESHRLEALCQAQLRGDISHHGEGQTQQCEGLSEAEKQNSYLINP